MASLEAILGNLNPAVVHGISLEAGDRPLGLETGAGTHVAVLTGVATAVVTIVVQHVVVVTAAIVAAVGWGTAARTGLGKAAQVDTLVIQQVVVVTAAVNVDWGEAVVTIVVVVDDDLGIKFLRSLLASLRLSGNTKFPSSSISISLSSKFSINCRNL